MALLGVAYVTIYEHYIHCTTDIDVADVRLGIDAQAGGF